MPMGIDDLTDEIRGRRAEDYVAGWPPERICEVLRPHLTDERALRIEEVLARRLARLTVIVENLHDPHNGAAALRSAEAVGLQDFHVVEGVEPFAVASGVALKSQQWVDVHRHASTRSCLRRLKETGFAVWAAAPGGDTLLDELPTSGRVALAFGNERDGLSEVALAEADGSFVIPMDGFTGSFNLSVSVALSVYHQARAMRAAMEQPGDLDRERVEHLRALWYCRSVRAAGLILERAGWPS